MEICAVKRDLLIWKVTGKDSVSPGWVVVMSPPLCGEDSKGGARENKCRGDVPAGSETKVRTENVEKEEPETIRAEAEMIDECQLPPTTEVLLVCCVNREEFKAAQASDKFC
ncbi:hypothetical protein AVEN_192179-1 [Araneus ventricosus]|uniref:Uncharacterized protein n=1 Tax=Araneus ventricosus TaxID=182803 RepID=A0A4Y2J3J3_ARAVE|nr:hypothetical protein AVEN_192179-1 [Araneus ventricosus]